jgi:hypothetical protein
LDSDRGTFLRHGIFSIHHSLGHCRDQQATRQDGTAKPEITVPPNGEKCTSIDKLCQFAKVVRADEAARRLTDVKLALARWMGKQSFILLGRFAAHQIK